MREIETKKGRERERERTLRILNHLNCIKKPGQGN